MKQAAEEAYHRHAAAELRSFFVASSLNHWANVLKESFLLVWVRDTQSGWIDVLGCSFGELLGGD